MSRRAKANLLGGGAFLLLCVSATAQNENAALLTNKISAASIIKGLPLQRHELTTSDNDRKKQRWAIVGANEYATFEVIGDIQTDADLAGWNCAEYDKAGSLKSAAADESFCRKFFVLVLRNVLSAPESVANDLLLKAKKVAPQSAILEVGDMNIETDGQYYFIRRRSRM